MLIPATRYADCETALAFLKKVIGMQEVAIHRNAAGQVVHAEMRMGDSLFMFGPEADTPFSRYMTAPRDTGGRETTVMYVVVGDVETHNAKAMAAGATIIIPLEEQDHGGLSYSLRDPEGHVWTIGSYDPRGT
ncbi:VOC family protein [Marinibacterium sp. SX1]|uniref:VOC family protein n=1 Tax=Marinibacterium sp. SX1 TaxID=3388424 RepID=UPI003D1774FE